MKDELLDLVNGNDEIIGTVWKSEAHKDPKLFHREAAIVVFNENQEVLLQQRSMSKKSAPGKWTLTAVGHIGRGEAPEIAAARELQEEMGLVVKPIYFKKTAIQYQENEARFFWVYYGIVKSDEKITIDKEEVQDAAWVPVTKLVEFSKTHNYLLTGVSHLRIMELAEMLGYLV